MVTSTIEKQDTKMRPIDEESDRKVQVFFVFSLPWQISFSRVKNKPTENKKKGSVLVHVCARGPRGSLL